MATTPVTLPGKSDARRSLVGYSPWGCKESDTTERLHFHFSLTHSHIFQVKHPWMQTANYSCQVRYWKGEMRKKRSRRGWRESRRGKGKYFSTFFKNKTLIKNKRTKRKTKMMELLPTALHANNMRDYSSEEKLVSRVKSI